MKLLLIDTKNKYADILAYFIAFCFFVYPFFFQGINSYILLASDTGNVASIIAAWMSPTSFEQDLVFSNPNHYQFYVSAILYLAYPLSHSFGDIGLAFHVMMVPLIRLQLIGFYRLGKVIFNTEYGAYALLLSNLLYINIGGGEYWGVFSFEALSRSFINALLPFLLLFLVEKKDIPTEWWKLFAILPFAFYCHSVSTPTLAFALGFTLLFLKVDNLTIFNRIKYLSLGSGLFLISLLPFIYLYTQAFITDNQMSDNMLFEHVGIYFQDVPTALKTIFNSKLDITVFILGIIGFVLKKEHRFLLLFLIGIVIGSAGLAFLDQTIANHLNRAPLQFDLIRNMRFIFPLSIIGTGLFLIHFKMRLLFIPLVLFTLYKNPLHYFVKPLVNEKAAPILAKRQTNIKHAKPIITYLKEQEEKHLVLPIGPAQAMDLEGLAIRYQAFHSIAYIKKDRNFLIYTNSPSYKKWEKRFNLMNEGKIKELIEETDSYYLHVDKDFAKKELLLEELTTYAEPIIETETRMLMKVKK